MFIVIAVYQNVRALSHPFYDPVILSSNQSIETRSRKVSSASRVSKYGLTVVMNHNNGSSFFLQYQRANNVYVSTNKHTVRQA